MLWLRLTKALLGVEAFAERSGRRRNRKAVPLLLAELTRSDFGSIASAKVIEALGEIGDERAVEALDERVSITAGVRCGDEHRATAVALTRIGGDRAVDALCRILLVGKTDAVKPAAEALGQARTPTALEGLTQSLLSPHIGDNVEPVAAALARYAPQEKAAKALVTWLERGQAGPSYGEERHAVSQALLPFGEVAADYLEKALGGDVLRPEARVSALRTLGRLGRSSWIQFGLQALHLDPPSARLFAASVLALPEFRGQVFERVLALLSDEDWRTREAAAAALGKMGDPRAVRMLDTAVIDDFADVRLSAVQALGAIGDRSGVDPLLAALNDEDLRVRLSAADALSKVGDRRAVGPLQAYLSHLLETKRHLQEQAYFKKARQLGSEISCARDALVAIGDGGSLGFLLENEELVGPYSVKKMLRRDAAGVPDRVLEELLRFEAVEWHWETRDSDGWGHNVPEPVDCTDIHRLAREELVRRGHGGNLP